MITIEEIFDFPPETWLHSLPKYQQNTINELYLNLDNYEEVAKVWLSASIPMNVPFGTEKGHSVFYDKVLDELEALFTGEERYKDTRLALLKESGAVQNYVVGLISVAFVPILGTSSAFLAPIIALALLTITKVGINAWIAKRKEAKNTLTIKEKDKLESN